MFLSTEKCFIYQGPATWEVFLASEFNQETTASTWETFKVLLTNDGTHGANTPMVCGSGNGQEEGLSSR